jgi:Putative peptidoglycan binding domain
LRLLSIHLARRWLLTLIVSELAVFAASYFYFTTTHALESLDTASCIPLTVGSTGKCVSRVQVLLNEDLRYRAASVDGSFGKQTRQAVIKFQSAHHLAKDGRVGSMTASAINESSPRPTILGYAAGFVNSTLALSARLSVAVLMIIVMITCLLLRAARAGSIRLLRIRCCLAGLFAVLAAANTAAMASLVTEVHSWVTKLLFFTFVGLTAALLRLLQEMSPSMTTVSDFTDRPPGGRHGF